MVIWRSRGGSTEKPILHGAPVAGWAVTVAEVAFSNEGATQVVLLPLPMSIPEVADQVHDTGVVSSTNSLTPTVVRVSAVPSGAASVVFDVIVQAARAGAAFEPGELGNGEGVFAGDRGAASLCPAGSVDAAPASCNAAPPPPPPLAPPPGPREAPVFGVTGARGCGAGLGA